MVVIALIAALLVTTVCVNALLNRRVGRADDIERHGRAIDALRDLAEHPRPLTAAPHYDEPPTDHIRILEHRPEGARPARTHTKRAAVSHRAGPRPRIDAPAPRPDEPAGTGAPGNPPGPPNPESPIPATISFDDASPSFPGEPVFAASRSTGREPRPHGDGGRRGRGALVAAASAATVALVGLLVASTLEPSHHANRATTPVSHAVEPPAPRTRVPAPPTTIALAPAQLLVSPTGNGTVTVRAPYAVTLSTNGPCWVSITDGTGHTVFEGTLQAGQHQDVPGAGPVDIRLGNTPVAQLTVNGTPLDLSKMSDVATLHFVATA